MHLLCASADVIALRAVLLEEEKRFGVDLNLQSAADRKRRRRLFAFDMDSTLIEAEVIDELAKLAGVGAPVAAVTAAAMSGEIGFKESFRQRMALLKGVREADALGLLECVTVTPGADELFAALRHAGCKTAVLSGGFSFFAEHLQRRWGIDHIRTNRLSVHGGVLTGEVSGEIVDGAYKAEALRKIAEQEGVALDAVVAVGDGANDLPMLAIAGAGVAYRAKTVLREVAGLRLTYSTLADLLELVTV